MQSVTVVEMGEQFLQLKPFPPSLGKGGFFSLNSLKMFNNTKKMILVGENIHDLYNKWEASNAYLMEKKISHSREALLWHPLTDACLSHLGSNYTALCIRHA